MNAQRLLLIVGHGPVVDDVLSFDPAECAHLVEEGLEDDLLLGARAGHEHAHAAQDGWPALRPQRWGVGREAGTDRDTKSVAPVH